MSNPIFNSSKNLGGQVPQGNIIQQFLQFKNEFKGDPQVAINNMLASGQINQNQLDIATKQAQAIADLMGR